MEMAASGSNAQAVSESKTRSGTRKREFEDDAVEYTLESPGAHDVTFSSLYVAHTPLLKVMYGGSNTTSDEKETITSLRRVLKTLTDDYDHDLTIIGLHGCVWKVSSKAIQLFSERAATVLNLTKKTLKMTGHPVFAVDCLVAHLTHLGDYRVNRILEKQELSHATSAPSKKVIIPKDLTAAEVHVEVLKIGVAWDIAYLKQLAVQGLYNALSSKGLTFVEFERLCIHTKVFTAVICGVPAICGDVYVRRALSELGTYAATQHEIWITKHHQEYFHLYTKAPYLVWYRDGAMREIPGKLQAFQLKNKKPRFDDEDTQRPDYSMMSIDG
ncbi:hypothetical protein P3342_001870 [Pyrenophora teres f. teres]|uniref:Uncharacterized protein n=1 Tax=Pyrenophora teres f. teres TaxID=97479 RepID=A0A6S6W3L6_9PLEO|nr:hypothetical protein HRS9139_03195 [Pyrenophora teres f. teres]KAE8844777.1 hypothetical protein PTNB85_03042 [Pyrenophora teres f. teres]KAE8866075.1 hypothetical protein PTNB29_03222 [Pyrenophora teres f. teres]KAK1919578.1 hypothetical protein P3342_001870 [Pyrenophora teres f. teres]CAE7177414.1 hypothetical protein PTTW11_06163 [Pyrenophora teres f. teres]